MASLNTQLMCSLLSQSKSEPLFLTLGHNLALLALAVAHNLREARTYCENRQQETENGQQPPETGTIPLPGAPITAATTLRFRWWRLLGNLCNLIRTPTSRRRNHHQ